MLYIIHNSKFLGKIDVFKIGVLMSEIQEKAKKLTIEDLAVVNFGSKELNSAIEQWRETATVCAAQSCARQTWFGDVETLQSFPITNSSELDYLVGKEAYLFLLRLMLGLETKGNICETNIAGQMNEGWRLFCEQLPEEAEKLKSIYDGLKADSRLIREKFLNQYKIPSKANAAISLVEKKNAETITIIAHGERNGGSLSQDVIDLINRFGAVKKNFSSEIIILADKAIQNILLGHVNRLRREKKLNPEVNISLLTDNTFNITEAFNKSSLVFCTRPMSPNEIESPSEIDMILAWDDKMLDDKKPGIEGARLVHLRGVPLLRGESSKLWRDFGLNGYSSPEQVANQNERLRVDNEKVIGLATHNASLFARIRYEGRQPGKKDLSFE
jgi:hypothetical protein